MNKQFYDSPAFDDNKRSRGSNFPMQICLLH